jgi:23S rRNA-/tRNA-specific pseudouridylate synthase
MSLETINHPNEEFVTINLLNRLDSSTSGVQLLSLSSEVSLLIKESFKKRQIEKVYYAMIIMESSINFPNIGEKYTWEDEMIVSKESSKIRASSHNHNDQNQRIARTNVTFLQKVSIPNFDIPCYIIELNPMTGFSHQLRYQCSKHHMPIVNDKIYGNFKANKIFQRYLRQYFASIPSKSSYHYDFQRLFLHSNAIKCHYHYNGINNNVSVQAPTPYEFQFLMNKD